MLFIFVASPSVMATVSKLEPELSSNSWTDCVVELVEYTGALSLTSVMVMVIVSVSGVVPSVARTTRS